MHEAAYTRWPISTTHTRHTPTGFSFCWWLSVGMGMPWVRAASKIVVPCATDTGVPSMINSTSFAAGLMIFSALTEANPSRTVAANNMVFHHTREMFHHRGDRNRHYLPKSTNACLPHGQRKFVHDLHVVFGASPFGPAFEHLDHFL